VERYTPPTRVHLVALRTYQKAWSSPTLFVEVIATKNTTFIERCFREADSNVLKGGFAKAAKTTSRSQLAIERVLAGRR
jgi:hypothetical protein